MLAEAMIEFLRSPQARPILIGLSIPFTAVLSYLGGRASVKVDRATVCAPVLADQAILRAQIVTLEGRLGECTLSRCDECFIDAEKACKERLDAQLAEVKRLRCKVCP